MVVRARRPSSHTATRTDVIRTWLSPRSAPVVRTSTPDQTTMRSIAYKFPKDGWQTILLLALFLYVDQADIGTIGARIRRVVGGPRTLDILRKLVVVVHIGEALGMLAVNVRRGATLGVAVGCSWLMSRSSGSRPRSCSVTPRGSPLVVR